MLEKSFEQFNNHTLLSLRKLAKVNDVILQESVEHLENTIPVNLMNDIPCTEHITSLLKVIGEEQYCDNHKIFKEEQIKAIKAAVDELEIFNLILRREEYDLEANEAVIEVKERLPYEEVLDKVIIKDRLPNIK